MEKTYQVTLYCVTGQYKPVSCLIKRNSDKGLDDEKFKTELIHDGVKKICMQRYWTQRDLKKHAYTKVKIRECGSVAS